MPINAIFGVISAQSDNLTFQNVWRSPFKFLHFKKSSKSDGVPHREFSARFSEYLAAEGLVGDVNSRYQRPEYLYRFPQISRGANFFSLWICSTYLISTERRNTIRNVRHKGFSSQQATSSQGTLFTGWCARASETLLQQVYKNTAATQFFHPNVNHYQKTLREKRRRERTPSSDRWPPQGADHPDPLYGDAAPA